MQRREAKNLQVKRTLVVTQLRNERKAYPQAPPQTSRSRTRFCRVQAAHTSGRKTGLGLGPQWVSFMGDELLSRPREAGPSYQRRCRTSPWSHPPKAGAGAHAAGLGKAYTLRHKARTVPGNLRAKSLTSDSLGRDWPRHHTETRSLKGEGGASTLSNSPRL